MEKHEVYIEHHINNFVELYLGGAERDKLDPILDICVNLYKCLEMESQIEFKAAAKLSYVPTVF
jgi:type I restriction enzyme R subunit